ncbi:MAG: hypothetical protein LQ350_007544 [Teloschistes chrysophthalmus]|nr:MAG: hypothetical protein LQ350_007544 [Niorma chrysophthalma]
MVSLFVPGFEIFEEGGCLGTEGMPLAPREKSKTNYHLDVTIQEDANAKAIPSTTPQSLNIHGKLLQQASLNIPSSSDSANKKMGDLTFYTPPVSAPTASHPPIATSSAPLATPSRTATTILNPNQPSLRSQDQGQSGREKRDDDGDGSVRGV